MKKIISISEMQKIELEILLSLQEICNRHRLRYYIDGGTLLGAYCYHGFIPWDDDIDIKMPRKDYEQLFTYADEFPKHLKLMSPEADAYTYSFAKIYDTRTVLIENPGTLREHRGHVYIDLLPMDGYPQGNMNARLIERYKTLFHQVKDGFIALKQSPSLLKKAKGYIYSCLYNSRNVYTRLTRLATFENYEKSEYVGLLVEGDRNKEMYRRESLDHSVFLPFEGYEFPASMDYEKHLVAFYGSHILESKDAYNLPYIAPAHNYDVYWRDSQ